MTNLSVENLSIGYETKNGLLKAVDNISFRLEQGRTLGMICLKMILILDAPATLDASINGRFFKESV